MNLRCTLKPSTRYAKKLVDISTLPLYGRSREIKVLEGVRTRLLDPECEQSEVVLVHGYSGTGKSALVKSVFDNESKTKYLPSTRKCRESYYVSGKFDQLRTAEPYSALIAAFDELCEKIFNSNESFELINSISSALGPDIMILSRMIPKLRDIVKRIDPRCDEGEETKVEDVDFRASQNHFKKTLRSFIEFICTEGRAVILFIDDLQWADKSSLEILKFLTVGLNLKQFLFVGSYRDNEVDRSHHLSSYLNELENSVKDIVKIPVGNLDVDTVNDLVSSLTKLDVEATQSLSDIVHRKTNGNIYFVLEYLEMLQEDGFVEYNFETCQWKWDVDAIQSKTSMSPNMVELVAKRIQRMDPDVQTVLKIGACLGSKFCVNLMEPIIQGLRRPDCRNIRNRTDLICILDLAASQGLVEKIRSGALYKFGHDSIQQAAYSLLFEGKERDMLHLGIGEVLWQVLQSDCDEDGIVFAAADQLNLCPIYFAKDIAWTDLVQLNLKAGKMALAIVACAAAERYLMAGIQVVVAQDNAWKQHYDLCLSLHNAAASVLYFNGKSDQCQSIIDVVMSTARCQKDQIHARIVHTNSLSSQNKLLAALDVGVDVLNLLGERFPKRPCPLRLMLSLKKTIRMVQDYSNESIMALPVMTDPTKIIAMKLMSDLISCSFLSGKKDLFLLLTIRMVKTSIKFGTSPFSSHGYASFGLAVTQLVGIKEAYRLGKLSLELLDQHGGNVCEARVSVIAGHYLIPWQEPLHNTLQLFLRGYTVGIEHQDIEWAFLSAAGYVTEYFFCGLPLGPVEEDMRALFKKLANNNQTLVLGSIRTLWQCSLNLMGKSADVMVLTGEAMDQEAVLLQAKKNDGASFIVMVQWSQLMLAYIFGDVEEAHKLSKKLWKARMKIPLYYCIYLYFAGLSSIELARRNTRKRWHYKRFAKKCIIKLKEFVRQGTVNCVHQLMLLKAEYSSLDYKSANYDLKRKYDRAIATATKSGFLRDVAIAYERAAIFHNKTKNISVASMYMTQAHQRYCQWGAAAKANQIVKKCCSLINPSGCCNYGSANLGVSRFFLKSELGDRTQDMSSSFSASGVSEIHGNLVQVLSHTA